MIIEASNTNIIEQAKHIVKQFLDASMVPDPETAYTFMSEEVDITFTGGMKFEHPKQSSAFNATRYKWVKKKVGLLDACMDGNVIVVYSFGTLYGEWPDGRPFEDNRYIDRFEIENGKIVKMDVLNDSAELILAAKDT